MCEFFVYFGLGKIRVRGYVGNNWGNLVMNCIDDVLFNSDVFQVDNGSVWENVFCGVLNVGVFKCDVIMVVVFFQLGW